MGKGRAQLGKMMKGAGISTQKLTGPLKDPAVAGRKQRYKAFVQFEKEPTASISDVERQKALSNLLIAREGQLQSMRAMMEFEKRMSGAPNVESRRKFRTQMREEKANSYMEMASERPGIDREKVANMQGAVAVNMEMFNSLNTIFLATTKKNSRAFEVLLKINDIKTKQMRERFDQNIHRLRRVYEAEAAEVLASHARISSEMKNEIIIFEEHNEAEANFSESLFRATRENEHNTSVEKLSNMRMYFDAVVDRLEKQFDECHHAYVSQNDERIRNFQKLVLRDLRHSNDIEDKSRLMAKLRQESSFFKRKIHRNVKSMQGTNGDIKREICVMQVHFFGLKTKLARFKAERKRYLVELSSSSRDASTNIKRCHQKASNLLTLAERSRKLELESEMVGKLTDDNFEFDFEGGEVPTIEDDMLNRINRKTAEAVVSLAEVHKVREQERLENERLRKAVKVFIEGVQVESTTLSSDNPLLIVNGNTNAVLDNAPGRTVQTVIDSRLVMQQRAALMRSG